MSLLGVPVVTIPIAGRPRSWPPRLPASALFEPPTLDGHSPPSSLAPPLSAGSSAGGQTTGRSDNEGTGALAVATVVAAAIDGDASRPFAAITKGLPGGVFDPRRADVATTRPKRLTGGASRR